ncbi:MAG: photosynthetic complex putative assembly protein PuhB [Geminicoccaceae bacterium]
MTQHYDDEPVRGLPEPLPPGEHILWQGEPVWRDLAVRALHARKLAVYFAVLLLWPGIAAYHDGASVAGAVWSSAKFLPLAAGVIGFLCVYAWLAARATVYTITNSRVVMRIGLALPIVLNLPFRQIASADFRPFADGTGDIALVPTDSGGVGYLHLWPHARRWHFNPAQPMLRAVPEGKKVAELLAGALTAANATPAPKAGPRLVVKGGVPVPPMANAA